MEIRGITERFGSASEFVFCLGSEPVVDLFVPCTLHFASGLAPRRPTSLRSRQSAFPTGTRRRLQMKLGEGRERGSGVGGLDLDPASAGAGATWRRRATAELWQHQLSSKVTSEEEEHHWEAGDVSECILLFGAFCNGEGREAVLYRGL